MNSLAQETRPTFESVWALLQETARNLEKSRIEFDQKMETSRAKMEESRIEFDQKMEKSRIEFEQNLEKSRIEFEQKREKSNADFDRRIKKLEELTGSWANNHGAFAEDYFFNSFENGKQNFFGEKFNTIEKNVKPLNAKIKDEYDIVLLNGKSVAIIEVKYRAHERSIPQVIKKAETFRVNFPDYANRQIYLGLASMSFYPEIEQECMNQGIAVVKQVGDTVVINDAHLRVF